MDDLDELRLKIAKARGYEVMHDQTKFIVTKDRGMVPRGSVVVGYVVPADAPMAWRCPDWPRDIAAAWELVEEMKKAGLYFKISTLSDVPENYHVIFRRTYDSAVEMFDAPAPEAISRAYLAWKEG